MCSRLLLPLFLSLFLGSLETRADELQTLEAAFLQGLVSRNDYLDQLCELRAKYVKGEFSKGSPALDQKILAIDEKIKKHPLLSSSNGQTLSQFRVGIWQAARHTCLFRSNHTWIMLPIVSGYNPQGIWRIEGNRYYESAPKYSSEKPEYLIIWADSRYFITEHGKQLFYEKNLKEYHGE